MTRPNHLLLLIQLRWQLFRNGLRKKNRQTELGVNVSGVLGIYNSPDNPELYKTYLDKVNNQGHLIEGLGQHPA